MGRDDAMVSTESPKLERIAFRSALGVYPTGVTVITTMSAGRVMGIVANSFTSVSLDPPLLLWCIGRRSSRFDAFASADQFVINVLARDHLDLCHSLSRAGGGDLPPGALCDELTGVAGALAVFECDTERVLMFGDHAVIVGRVSRFSNGPADLPLVFHSGRFTSIETTVSAAT